MTSLEFKSIRLKNYRQYSGEQEVDLSTDGGRINVIEGQNGAGKSNLLNAISLCFYGQETHQNNTDENHESLPYISRNLLEDVDEGGKVTGFIEITLGTDNPQYIFRREFATYRQKDNFANTLQELKLQRKDGANWKEPTNPDTHLNQILPATVSDYFLFDGEDLDAFFEEGYTDRVRAAILDVSHIELLNRAKNHLEKVRDDIESKADDLEGEAGKIREEKQSVEAEIEDLEEEYRGTEVTIEDTENEIARIERKLQDISDDYVKNLYQERESLAEEVTRKDRKISDLESQSAELMIEAGPAVYTRESLSYTLELFNDLAEKGQIPPKIQDWFIDELIDRGQCICGTSLAEGDEHAEHLRELKTEMSEVMEENLEGKTIIPAYLDKAADRVESLHENRRRIAELKDEIDDKKQRIQNITNQLRRYDIPDDDEDIDIEFLEDQREELKDQISDLTTKLGKLDNQIENKEDEKQRLEKELRRELQKEERFKDISDKLDFADNAHSHLERIRSKILSDIRDSTEDNLEEYFNELIWKDEDYDIVLHEDYSVEVKDPYGDNKIGSLSAGEKQVLALSFMAALTQISGFDAPIVIDTPLGRISSDPKRLIAKNLPNYVEDTQITFLMTDEEYTNEVRAMMEGSLANEYKLDYDNSVTQVVPR